MANRARFPPVGHCPFQADSRPACRSPSREMRRSSASTSFTSSSANFRRACAASSAKGESRFPPSKNADTTRWKSSAIGKSCFTGGRHFPEVIRPGAAFAPAQPQRRLTSGNVPGKPQSRYPLRNKRPIHIQITPAMHDTRFLLPCLRFQKYHGYGSHFFNRCPFQRYKSA